MQALLRRFPPHSVIRPPATAMGLRAFALIRSYDPAGRYVRVVLHVWDTSEKWKRVQPNGAEYFGAWRGLTPERVAELLAGKE